MKFITANMKNQEKFDTSADTTVFLAGPITFAPDWQIKFFDNLIRYYHDNSDKGSNKITVYSPRWIIPGSYDNLDECFTFLKLLSKKDNLDDSPFDMQKQYDWESYHLKAVDIVVFGFVPYVGEPKFDRSYARTTRIELGEAIGRNYALKEYQEDLPYNQEILVYKDKDYTDDKDGYIDLKVRENGFVCTSDWNEIFDIILSKTKRNVEDFNELKLQVRGVDAYGYADKYNQ